MINQPTPPQPTTQKAARRAAAVAGNDRTRFRATRFGRLRVRSLPVRLIVGFIELLWSPFAYIGGGNRTVAARRPFRISLRPPLRFPPAVPLQSDRDRSAQ